MSETKVYIGDGVYMEVLSPAEIKLTTENGYSVQNEIFVDLNMLARMQQEADRIIEAHNGS